jgi:two-component system, NtrC family, response regulator HydG
MLELDFRKDPTVLSAIVDTLRDGVFTVDARGHFMAWSSGAERITSYSSAEIVKKPCSVLKGKSSNGFGSLIEILDDIPSSQAQVLSKQWSIVTKRGRELTLDVSLRILRAKSGEVIGAIGSFKDVSSMFADAEKVAVPERGKKITEAFNELLGKSKAMGEVIRKIRLAAQSDVTVLLTGESGTGKELAARAIHAVSLRKGKPFLGVNCSAIPDTLLESELFGHTKGAFTGAMKDKTGIFQQAEGGTLFLDEIGDMSAMLQVKLLRVLQEREIRRLGDEKVDHSDK